MKLKGKVAFISGFGSGIGQAIAVMFAKEGALVAGTSKTEAKGRETLRLVEKGGGSGLISGPVMWRIQPRCDDSSRRRSRSSADWTFWSTARA